MDELKIDHATNRTFDQPVCFMNMLFESNMNPVGSQIDINLKQMTATDPNLECYFWCSFDGLVPIRPDIETIDLSLLKKRINVPLVKDTKLYSLAISHVNLYSMKIKKWICSQEKCQWEIGLVQHMIKNSFLNIQCSLLGNEVCGSFGLSLHSNSNEVCFVNHTYSFEMPDKIVIWAYNTSTIDLNCSFWTSDQPGEALGNQNFEEIPLDESLLESSMREIQFNQTVPVSPVKVYELKYTNTNSKCHSKICKAEIDFTWLWDKTCVQKLYCPLLSGNICGDYGLSLNDEDICHSSTIFKSILKHESVLELWYQDSANISLHCYYWCHNNVAAMFWNTSLDTELLIDIVSF